MAPEKKGSTKSKEQTPPKKAPRPNEIRIVTDEAISTPKKGSKPLTEGDGDS